MAGRKRRAPQQPNEECNPDIEENEDEQVANVEAAPPPAASAVEERKRKDRELARR
jgi:hypothetical protein